ncbi:MAG TPA: HD-GYP domain-containing protein [Vicinamibacterales bacterium]|nr:HD-GYP domain-containing protein [Vicinamibacterales bacterium]
MTVTFATVAVILTIVFIVITLDVRDRVRAAETDKLRVSENVFTALETKRQQDQVAAMATLAENPTLKAALDTYFTERRFSGSSDEQLRATVMGEAAKLATQTPADVLAVVENNGRIFTSAGPAASHWRVGDTVDVPRGSQATFQNVAVLPSGAFRVTGARLTFGDRVIGALVAGTNLDANYAQELSSLSTAGVVITVNNAIVARTVPENVARDLVASKLTAATATLGGEEYAIRTMLASGPARIYTLTSIDAAARSAERDALVAVGLIAFGGFILAAIGSFILARLLSEPINRVSGEIATMTNAREFGRTLELTGSSRELDALTTAFNDLMRGLSAAEAETRSAYLGAIRALAAALDARDPYTAGHSERVSTLSVMMGRMMNLEAGTLEVVRLGALLHDIGKIGVGDDILRKNGPLTPEEFEQIKRHPALGARILRQVPFLAPHLPIVELHHERPDGRGYPFGLRGDDIPLDARIVHVADAFDAMTSARAYRAALPASVAFAELQRFSGTQFDPACVEALLAAMPSSHDIGEPALAQLLARQVV